MKKVLAILAGTVLIVLLAACDISSYFKPKTDQQTQQQTTQNPPPADTTQPQQGTTEPTPPPETTQPPPRQTQPPPVQHKPAPVEPPVTQPAPTTPPPVSAEPATPVEPPAKIRRGGLGVIFTGNLEQGQFRVKVDQDVVYELAFSGKETRATKELSIPEGQHLIRFAVIDAKGVRGIKEETFNIKPGSHQTVRVSVKDTPGAIIVEHLQ